MPDLHSSSLLSIGQLCDENYSAAEAVTGGAFENAQNLVIIRRICENVVNHLQPKEGFPLITDNSSSTGILTKLIKPRRSKS